MRCAPCIAESVGEHELVREERGVGWVIRDGVEVSADNDGEERECEAGLLILPIPFSAIR
jgi:hypothetical protein